MSYAVTIASGIATVSLTNATGISAAAAQILVNGITYQNTSVDNPTAGNRTFTLTQIKDSGGTANSGLGATVSTAVPVFSTATVNAGEASQNITSLVFQVSGLADGANEKITVDGVTIALGGNVSGVTALPNNVMNYSVTVVGSTATVTLSKVSGITASAAQTLITGITYQNTNVDNPTPGLRTFDITSLTDSSGSANATATFAAGTNSASVLVTALNDGPAFSSNTAPTGLTTTKSQSPSRALNISLSGFQVSDADGGNTIESLSFGLGDIPPLTPPGSWNGTNPMAPLNINFPNKPSSLYLGKTSDNTYTVFGTVSDLNQWLSLSNAITYNPRSTFTPGTTYPNGLKVVDSFGGILNSNTFTVSVTADATAPLFSKAVFSREAANKIILSYDEPLNTTPANLPPVSSFTVTGTTVSSVAVVGTNIVLTTAANVSPSATITYTKPGSGIAAIQDAAGVQSVTTSAVAITSDTSPPVLDASPVFYNANGWGLNKFIISFNEELASASNSDVTGFNISGFSASVVDPLLPDRSNGAVAFDWYQSGGSNSTSERSIVLSLRSGNLSPSASLQIKYVDPGVGNLNALKDLAGNHAGNMVLGAWTNDNLSAVDATNFTAGKSVLVVGGQGNDTMTGGLANDTFAWFAGDAGTTTGAVDIVKSFTAWNGTAGDKLDIGKLLTNGYVSGTSTLSQWVTSVTNNASGAPSGVGTTNTKIVIDVDGTGSGTVTQTIWLDGVNLTLISGTLDQQLTNLKNTQQVLIA